MEHFHAIVIGQGAMGLATSYALSKRKLKVLGIEQHTLFHSKGSSHGETRAIRMAYFENSSYIPLLQGAYKLWSELEQTCHEELFNKCGITFYCDPITSEVYKGVCKSSDEYNIPIEKLSIEEAAIRYPFFKAPKHFKVLNEKNAGFIHVERALQALANSSKNRGVLIHENETLLSWKENKKIEITTNKGHYTCDKLIFTSGAWSSQFLKELPLNIYRALLYWFEAPASATKYPSFGFHLEDDFYYGFPSLDGKTVKVAAHFKIDPIKKPEDKEISIVPQKNLDAITHFVKNCLPELGKFVRFSPCIYTMTPDEHFIIDQHPQSRNVFFACGFSGHGFKFTPIIGEILAMLSMEGSTHYSIDFLRQSRF